ncbi:hypothetical protein L7F22_006178 [Adiantum nelumboides]|nr:hypothetical protein [Adiantum nelumboides]
MCVVKPRKESAILERHGLGPDTSRGDVLKTAKSRQEKRTNAALLGRCGALCGRFCVGLHLARDQKIILQLFRLYLQDGARLWFNDFGAQLRDVCYDAVKEAFLAHYKHVEDASDVWHQLEACLQKEDECVDAYAWRFSQLWNRWRIALRGQVPPFMLKKHHFVVGLRGVLKLKGVHDVHVDEIEAHVPIEEEKDMANALATNHVEEMPIVLNVVEYEHEESVAKNVACDEVSFGLCALDVDNMLTSRTMDVFGVALGHVLLDFMARSMVALVLYDGLCYICGLQQVYDACMVNKKQGIDCIVDDDDWVFDDPAVEMNEEMQPFVDAALGRIWVMREQQSHEVVMNSSEAIHMYGREGGSDVCVGFDYGLANIKIERNLWDMFTMEDGARLWFNDFGAQLRDVCYDAVKEAFLAHYKHVEDASDVWHQLEACLQKEDECVDAYAWRFSQLWNRWRIALRGQVPPFMLKKHHFVVGLRGVLKLKVECKRPQNYEDALRIAKDKEWKLKHQQDGVGNTSMP